MPHVGDFIGSIPLTFADMVDHITLPPPVLVDRFILKNRAKLQKSIRKFHVEADTMTTDVSDKISSLSNNNTQIFVSTHQPNLFSYAGIFKKIVLLHTFKDSVENVDQNRKTIDLFVIIDHDFMDELWVHLAQLPSIWHSSGTLEIRLPVSKSVSRKMICNAPLPGRAVLDLWKAQVKRWIAKSVSSIKMVPTSTMLLGVTISQDRNSKKTACLLYGFTWL